MWAVLVVVGCGGDGGTGASVPREPSAIVTTAAFDYATGAVAMVTRADLDVVDALAPVTGDAIVRVDDGVILVMNRAADHTVRLFAEPTFDAPTLEINLADQGRNPQDAAICNGELWVLLYETDSVARYDPATGAFRGAVSLADHHDGDGVGPEAASLVEDDGVLWVALQRLDRSNAWQDAGGRIVGIDCADARVVASVDAPGNAFVARGDDRIVVGGRPFGTMAGGLYELDTASATLTQLVSLEADYAWESVAVRGDRAIGVAALVDASGYAVLCADLTRGDVEVIDVTTDYLRAIVPEPGTDRAWSVARSGWLHPDAASPGLHLWDVPTCARSDGGPIETRLEPYDLAFWEP